MHNLLCSFHDLHPCPFVPTDPRWSASYQSAWAVHAEVHLLPFIEKMRDSPLWEKKVCQVILDKCWCGQAEWVYKECVQRVGGTVSDALVLRITAAFRHPVRTLTTIIIIIVKTTVIVSISFRHPVRTVINTNNSRYASVIWLGRLSHPIPHCGSLQYVCVCGRVRVCVCVCVCMCATSAKPSH